MPLKTTVGQLLINEALPPEMRDYNRTLDKKGIAKLFQEIAEKRPDLYKDVAQKLSDVGRDVAYTTGGFSFGLRDMLPSKVAQVARQQIESEVRSIQANPRLTDDQKEEAIIRAVGRHQQTLEGQIFAEAKASKNPLAGQIMSGARGSPMNLKSLLGADLLYVDHHAREIPIPVLNPYPRGLSPVEYWAGAFGARKGVADTKFATQEAGYFAKQLNQIDHRLVVTQQDDDEDDDANGAIRGLPVDTDDGDSAGALLAQPVGTYKRNTVLTPRILKDLQNQGIKRIVVRSPMIGGPAQGGVFARDVGVRERGGMAPLGDQVGLAAAQALSEKLTQGQLSSKHSGGVAGAEQAVTGFKYINQLIQVPKTFKGGAAHAQVDGIVNNVTDAPQGGKYIFVGGEQHYVPHGVDIKVKPGDAIEAGDVLSAGIPNPAEIVKHKGIGEGRRYFMNTFRKAYSDSGMGADRRNIELLSRGLIDHVNVTDEFGDFVPDDVTSYSTIERNWQPRDGTRAMNTTSAAGKYLERPILHYSIGTKIRPSIIKELGEFGVSNVEVHDDPPPFEPVMIRGASNLQHDPDFITRHLGSGLQKATLGAVHLGGTSDASGTSYVPAKVWNPTEFGRQGLVQGWKPKTPSVLSTPPTRGPSDNVLSPL